MIKPYVGKDEITDISDFNDVASEMYDTFIVSLMEDRFSRPIEESEDLFDGRASREFTTRAMRLIERYRDRLARVAERYFDDDELSYLDIWSGTLVEE